MREAPELRIVSEELWERVLRRMARADAGVRRAGKGATPRTLFGAGALRCATCGAAIVGINGQRYGCSAHKDRGPTVCTQGATVRRDLLERRLLGVLREELLAPAALAEVQAEVRRLLQEHARTLRSGRNAAQERLQAVQGEIGRIVDAIAAVGISPALQSRLAAAEAERQALEEQTKPRRASGAVPEVHDVLGRYRQHVINLQQVLAEDEIGRAHV